MSSFDDNSLKHYRKLKHYEHLGGSLNLSQKNALNEMQAPQHSSSLLQEVPQPHGRNLSPFHQYKSNHYRHPEKGNPQHILFMCAMPLSRSSQAKKDKFKVC